MKGFVETLFPTSVLLSREGNSSSINIMQGIVGIFSFQKRFEQFLGGS